MSETAVAQLHPQKRDCACCNNTRSVETALGEKRPCSRCSADAFDAWYNDRRPNKDKSHDG